MKKEPKYIRLDVPDNFTDAQLRDIKDYLEMYKKHFIDTIESERQVVEALKQFSRGNYE